MQGDSTLHNTDALAFMREMQSESVDLIVTDPPYKVVSGGQGADRDNGYHTSVIKGVHNGKIFNHQHVAPDHYLPEFYRLLRPGTHCYVMSNRINLKDMLNAADVAGFHLHNILRWDKPNVNTNRWYMIDCEFTLMLAKRPVKTINQPGSKQGFKCAVEGHKWHPTQKPVALMEHYILNSSEPGQIVFDPFMGAGSTLVAAANNGREWLGCEIDPTWFNIAFVRLWGK